tara:strand:- start:1130 stop:1423 length:294 start_codon:yes stop_codon:yes gene_type:complete
LKKGKANKLEEITEQPVDTVTTPAVRDNWEFRLGDEIQPNRAYSFKEAQTILHNPSEWTMYQWIKNDGLVGTTLTGKPRGKRLFMGYDLIKFIRGRS